IYAASPQLIFVVGGDYKRENEPSTNFARSSDSGKTWTAGPPLPGYRSAIGGVAGPSPLYVAVGPSGTDFIHDTAGPWIGNGTVGYDAVSFVRGAPAGWATGANGRIATWSSARNR